LQQRDGSPIDLHREVIYWRELLTCVSVDSRPYSRRGACRRSIAMQIQAPVSARSVLIAIVVTASVVAYTLQPHGNLAIGSDCQLDGLIAHVRASVQGSRFWVQQAKLLRAEIRRIETGPERRESLRALTDQIIADSRERMAALSEKYPSRRPSDAKLQADALRHEADEIEREERQAKMDEWDEERRQRLMRCEPTVLARR